MLNGMLQVGTLAGISDDVENLRVNRDDFLNAMEEVQPAFGAAKEELDHVVENGIIHYSTTVEVSTTVLLLSVLLIVRAAHPPLG